MPDAKITALTALAAANVASTDVLAIVDISDTTQDASGTSKKITVGDLYDAMPDGLVGTPGLAFASDPNTGIYRVGADTLGIVTGGVKQIDVGANGVTTMGDPAKASLAFDADTDGAAITSSTSALTLRPHYVGEITGNNVTATGLLIATSYAGTRFSGTGTGRSWVGINVAPFIEVGRGATDGPTLAAIRGLTFRPTMVDQSTNVNSTVTDVTAVNANPNTGMAVTLSRGVYSYVQVPLGTVATGICFDGGTQTTSGAVTTAIGLRLTDIGAGTTKWGFQIGNYSSYHQGRVAFGGTTAPTCGIDIQATAADSSAIRFAAAGATPTNPTSNTDLKIYFKSSAIVFQFNDAGTVRYKYLTLSGTGVTWVHSTTAP
jgi:hypothetical protein